MTLVASSVPNLVSGVSQQPAPSRLRTSGEQMSNAFPSIVSGLMKRPPLEWRAKITTVMPTSINSLAHFIERDPTERYVLVVADGDLELFDIEGVAQTVTFPDGKGYLPTTMSPEKLRFVTVADTTFLLNTEKVVSASDITETRDNPAETASVFIKRAVASVAYAVYVNGVLAGTFTTSDNTTAGTALEGTATIAAGIAADMVSNGYTDAQAIGTTVTFSITAGDSVTVLDEFGGNAMAPYTDTVQEFEDLPPSEAEGRLVKISGSLEEDSSSYWVIYEDGIWTETVGYDEQRQLDASTMPHVFVKTAPNTFEFRQNEWIARPSGDSESNPDPSFVGSTINSIFLHKGRLGFLSEENLIMSEVALFESLYLTTSLQLLDSDPIDVAAATGRVSTLRHAVSFNDELLLFSDLVQFRVTSGTVLSPNTVGITTTSAYPCSRDVPPALAGSSAYFLSETATHSTAREIYFEPDGETVRSEDVSVQVPKYIPKDVKILTASENNEFLAAVSNGVTPEQPKIYVYKWYVTEQRKVQSAWGEWDFGDGAIIGLTFIDQYLYVVSRWSGFLRIERVAIGPNIDESFLLDHYVTSGFGDDTLAGISYNAGTDLTTLRLDSDTQQTYRWFRLDDGSGDEYAGVVRLNDTQYTVPGDLTTHQFVGGLDYEFCYEYSTQYLREETPDGEASIQDGRLQLRYFSQIYTDTAYFQARVTDQDGNVNTTTFDARLISNPDDTSDVIPRDTGEFKFPIFGENEQVSVKLVNSEPWRCAFGSMEWTGSYKPKARRVR